MPLEKIGSKNNPYLLGTIDMGQNTTKVIEFDKIINSEYDYTLKIISGPGILTGTNFSYTSQHDEVGIKTILLKFEDVYKQEMYLQFSINVVTNNKVFIDTDAYGRVKNFDENIYYFNVKAGETFTLDLSQYTTDSRNQFPLRYYLKDKDYTNKFTLKNINIDKNYNVTFTQKTNQNISITGLDPDKEYQIVFRQENDENKEVLENIDITKEYIIKFVKDPEFDQDLDIGYLDENSGLYTWNINKKYYGRYNIQFIVEDVYGNKQSQYIEINVERLSIDEFILDTDGFLTSQYVDLNHDFYFNLDEVNLNPYKEETRYQLITQTGMIFSRGGDYYYHLPQANYDWQEKIIDFIQISSDNIITPLKIKLRIVPLPNTVKQINPLDGQSDISLNPVIQWYPATASSRVSKVGSYDVWLYQKPDSMEENFIENLLLYEQIHGDFRDDIFSQYAIKIQSKVDTFYINSYDGRKIYYYNLTRNLIPNKKYYLRIDSWSTRGIKNKGPVTTFYTNNLSVLPIKDTFENDFDDNGWEHTNNVYVEDIDNLPNFSNQYSNVVKMDVSDTSLLSSGYYTEELKLHVSIPQENMYLYFNYINLDNNSEFDIFINQESLKSIPYSNKWKREIIELPIGEYDLSFKLRNMNGENSSVLIENVNINSEIPYALPIIVNGYPDNKIINMNESLIMNQIDPSNDDLLFDVYLGESEDSLNLIYSDLQTNQVKILDFVEENKTYYWKFVQKKYKIENGELIMVESDIYKFSTKSTRLTGNFNFNATYNYLHNSVTLTWSSIDGQEEYYIYRKKKI